MPTSRLESVRAAANGGIAERLATAGGALLLILALLASLVLVADIFGSYGANRPLLGPDRFELFTSMFGLGFAAAALLAVPATLAAPFRRTGDPPLRSHAALALVPGGLLALALLIGAIAAVAALSGSGLGTGLATAVRHVEGMLTGFVFLYIPIAIVFAAVLGGARTPEATAAAAAPVVLAGLSGVFADLSIAGLLLSVLLPLLAAAIALAILYAFAPARTVTPWLVGIALAIGTTLLVVSGFVTPSEAMGLMALLGIPIALLVRVLALRQPIGAMLRQAATETASIILILAASAMAGMAYLLATQAPVPGIGAPEALLIGGGAAFLAASYLVTSALALGLALPFILPMLRPAGIDPTLTAAILILLGLAAVAARTARRDPAAPAMSLPPAAAFTAAAVFVVLAAVIAVVPEFALGPVRALRI